MANSTRPSPVSGVFAAPAGRRFSWIPSVLTSRSFVTRAPPPRPGGGPSPAAPMIGGEAPLRHEDPPARQLRDPGFGKLLAIAQELELLLGCRRQLLAGHPDGAQARGAP